MAISDTPDRTYVLGKGNVASASGDEPSLILRRIGPLAHRPDEAKDSILLKTANSVRLAPYGSDKR